MKTSLERNHVFAQVQRPWWATAEFEPYGTEIEGVALARLDPSWVSATALTDGLLPEDAFPSWESLRDRNGAFEVLRDLTGDGRDDKAVVGVYRADTGEAGRFLLVLIANGNGNWSKHSLIKLPGEARFTWLRNQANELQWWFCFGDCDSMCTVVAAETGSECRFPTMGLEGPCTTFATVDRLESTGFLGARAPVNAPSARFSDARGSR